MLAVIAYFKDGSLDLLGFANTEDQVNGLVEQYINRNGAEYLGSKGVRFHAELAA